MNNSYTSSVTRISLLGIVIPLLLASFPAHAETTNCTAITSLPAVITSQGAYCLTGNLSTSLTSGNAIEIQANNVAIDLNGYKLGGLAAGPSTTANGIYADQQKNITIRNGVLRGFERGIFLDDVSPYSTSSGHLIEDIVADKNRRIGLDVRGTGITVRNNRIVDTGGASSPICIHARGPGGRIINNDCVNMIHTRTDGNPTGSASIDLHSSDGSIVENNRVANDALPPTGWSSVGIEIAYSADVMVVNNRVSTITLCVFYWGGGALSTGVYRDNITSNCTNPYTRGTDAGNNW